ncbi:MAG: M12 family metallo-peptidase [Steroidobacteraceae bacterium]
MLGRSIIIKPLFSVIAFTCLTTVILPVHAIESEHTTLQINSYTAFDDRIVIGSKQVQSSSSEQGQQRKLSINGKQVNLNLQANSNLDAALPTDGSVEVLRGSLTEMNQSWARLTRTASGIHGLIWDGSELYAVEPSAEIRSLLASTLAAPSSNTIMFKLSDTTVDLGSDYCGTEGRMGDVAPTGLATYQALTSEISQTNGSSAGEQPSRRLELQALADAAFRAQYSSDQAARDAIIIRLNNVDGIFTEQMGLQIQATDITVYNTDPSSLSNSTNADNLLSSLGQLRKNTPGMSTYAATHLFTGRDLDGDTLGIAYIGNICGSRYGTSLSESRNRGAWIDSLVVAHELGHQLGAVHDGTGICANTSTQNYLMSPQINGSTEFSQCSHDSILSTMSSAACLVPLGTSETSIVAMANEPVESSSGGGGAYDAAFLILLSGFAALRRASLIGQ